MHENCKKSRAVNIIHEYDKWIGVKKWSASKKRESHREYANVPSEQRHAQRKVIHTQC